ncbi:MAG: peptidylprolyl isomerase [Solirubrobacteraceae bacterium]
MDDTVHALVATPAFAISGEGFTHGDVLLAAIAWEQWQALERLLAEGLARVAAAERRGEQPTEEEIRVAVVGLRRARRLMAGEDYRRWLDARSLSAGAVTDHARRTLLRERPVAAAGDEPASDVLAAAVRAEAILSDRLRDWAARLAACAAAAHALGHDSSAPPAPSDDEIERLVAAVDACRAPPMAQDGARRRAPRILSLLAAERIFRERTVTEERIDRSLTDHHLDWQRYTWQEVGFASEGAAREGALWVGEEGAPLAEVAAVAGVTVRAREAFGCDVPEFVGLLSTAAPGEPVGPVRADDGWRVLVLDDRRPPAADDPEVRDRAASEIIDDALQRHLAGRLSWHGEL